MSTAKAPLATGHGIVMPGTRYGMEGMVDHALLRQASFVVISWQQGNAVLLSEASELSNKCYARIQWHKS